MTIGIVKNNSNSKLKNMAVLFWITILCCSMECVQGHGILMEPPGRSSAWRVGFNTPKNYDDNALYCGGFSRQQNNGGKCGVCGDPWNGVRENEAGGKYATGTIVRSYKEGQAIPVTVDITVNHLGWMEFRLCPNNNIHRAITHDCLNRHVLALADGSGNRYAVTTGRRGYYNIKVKLPDGLTCSQCVLQWKYHAGNSWGRDPVTKQQCMGCGPQEEFYGCADIEIKPRSGVPPTRPSTTESPSSPTTSATRKTTPVVATTKKQSTENHQTPSSQPTRCRAVNLWAGQPGMDAWCTRQCARGNCPSYGCSCTVQAQSSTTTTKTSTTAAMTPSTTLKTSKTTQKQPSTKLVIGPTPHQQHTSCHAVNMWAGQPVMDAWCARQCAIGNCPSIGCACSIQGQHFTELSTTKSTLPSTVSSTTTTPLLTTPTTTRTRHSTQKTQGSQSHAVSCYAINYWAGRPVMDRWCSESCARGNCPEASCRCSGQAVTKQSTTETPSTTVAITTRPTSTLRSTTITLSAVPPAHTVITQQKECKAIDIWEGISFFDNWCTENCNKGTCPSITCSCAIDPESANRIPPTITMAPLIAFTNAPTTTVSSHARCRSNGVVVGKHWDNWCQQSCDRGSCQTSYCIC